MILDNSREIPYVTHLVTHPGSVGAGGALIEQAINKSVEWGKEGRLELTRFNSNAEQVYESLGFVKSGLAMKLDPGGNNDKWSRQDDGEWRLKKHQGKKYIDGFGK
jgi:hypothetical protein